MEDHYIAGLVDGEGSFHVARTHVLVVRNRQGLTMKVIPFFDRYSLHTVKKSDFESFKRIVVMMNSELHLATDGSGKSSASLIQ
jgi:hypothetical protein